MAAIEKNQLDIRDFWRIHDGLEAYAGLGPKETLERLKAHPEDAFCEVSNVSGSGKLMCTRDAFDAVFSLARRHVDSLPIPDDYSVDDLAQGIRKHLARAMVEEKADEPALARVLATAVAESTANHVERTYHFPCVLVRPEQPPQFQIGPVEFTSAPEFPQFIKVAFERYVEESSDREHSLQRVEDFKKHVSDIGWVGTVTIPPCSSASAENRAERAISTAITLLRLFFGVPHARDMRLAHASHSRAPYGQHAVETNGKLDLHMFRRVPEALVGDDWHVSMDRFPIFWKRAAHLLRTTVQGKRSEIANRLMDALSWFGEAAFEPAPGTQIVKFVAALERLTTTERLRTRSFCARVALLSHDNHNGFEQRFWDAYAIYDARSSVVHGGVSSTSTDFQKHILLAHDVARNALFRGLEIHCRLDDGGAMSTLGELHNFFESELTKKAKALTRLYGEFKSKRKHP